MTEGTKYHPLFEYLLFSGRGRMSMSFSEIEAVIGASLPASARKREEWWSNSPSGHSQARAWMRASYRTSKVDLKGEKVDFTLEGWPAAYRKVDTVPVVRQPGLGESAQTDYERPRIGQGGQGPGAADHPLFGIWKGKVALVPGYDYTKPAFEPDATS